MRRNVYRAAVAVALVAVAVLTFSVARQVRGMGGGQLAAAQPAQPTPPPVPPGGLPANPDTTKPWWHVPYLQAERAKPRFDQTINGITVGPTSKQRGGPVCVPGSAQDVAIDQAAGTPVMLTPKYLPVGIAQSVASAVVCQVGGAKQAIGTERQYWVEPDRKAGRRGGTVTIARRYGGPRVAIDIPAERWSAGTVAGHPAAIAKPILPMGLGQSAVVVYANGVITWLQATSFTLDELLRIAEGLY